MAGAGNAVVGALRVVLGADTASLEKGLKTAQFSLARFSAGTKAMAGAMVNLQTAMAAVAAGSMVSLIKRSAEYGDQLAKTSKRLGISSDAFQELSYAAGLSGVSQEELTKALEQFSKRLGEVGGATTEGAKSLGKLGLSMASLKGQTPDAALKIVADRLNGIKDPMQRAAITAELFGKAGAKLTNFLSEGSRGMAVLALEARKMGLILSKETLAKAEEAADEFDRLGMASKVAGVNITAGFLPALTSLRETMTSQQFQDGVKSFGENLGVAIKWMTDNQDTVMKVAAAFAGMKLGAAFGRAFGGRGAVIGGVTGALVALGAAAQMVDDETKDLPKIIVTPNKPVGPDIDPSALDAARRLGEVMQDLTFRTQLTRGEFDRLAPGFAEAARGLRLFGQNGIEARTSVESLSPGLQALNAKFLEFSRAKLIEDMAPPWQRLGNEIARVKLLLDGTVATQAAVNAKIMQLQFPNLSGFIRESGDAMRQFDQVAANSLSTFSDSMADAVTGTKTLADSFRDMANSIARDLARMAIRSAMGNLLGSVMGGLSGGLSGASVGDATFGGFSMAGANAAIVKAAGGGVIPAGGLGLVSEHAPGGGRFIRAGSEPITVTPHDIGEPGGAVSISMPVTVHGSNIGDPKAFAAAIVRQAVAQVPAAVRQAQSRRQI